MPPLLSVVLLGSAFLPMRQFYGRAMSQFLPLSFQSSVDLTLLQFVNPAAKPSPCSCRHCYFSVVFSSTFQPFFFQFCRRTEAPSSAIVTPGLCLVQQFCRLSVLLSRRVSVLYTVEQFCNLSVLQQSRADHQVRSECCYHCSFIVVLESNDWGHNRTWNARTASVKTSPIQVFIGYKTLIEPC